MTLKKPLKKVDAGKVLVVDDDELSLTVMENILSGFGYEAATCRRSVDALQIMETFSPGIVITDLMMPEMDGITLLGKIKSFWPSTQVIIYTAHGDVKNSVASFRDGAVDFLTKPVTDEELAVALRRARERCILSGSDEGGSHLRDIVRAALESADFEKARTVESLRLRISKVIYPQIDLMMGEAGDENTKEGLKFIRELLDSLFSPSSAIVAEYAKLSPMEVKICNMLIQGKSSQEISDALNRSLDTIYDHQKKIRAHLGLTKSRKSLVTFLRGSKKSGDASLDQHGPF